MYLIFGDFKDRIGFFIIEYLFYNLYFLWILEKYLNLNEIFQQIFS